MSQDPPRWGPHQMLSRVGLSRHSALSVARALSTPRPRSFALQAASLVLGSGLIGFAVALLVEGRLGLAPYDVLASGLSRQVGISLGQASWALAGALFAAATFLGQPPSWWGVTYIFLNGVAIDAASGLLQHPSSMLVRVLFVPAGIVVMALGVNVVVHSGTTGGPFELIMAAGDARGISRLKIRYGLDLGVLALGLLLGGTFGIGTLVFGATMGPTIMAASQFLQDHRNGRSHRAAEQSHVDEEYATRPRAPVDEVRALLHSRM